MRKSVLDKPCGHGHDGPCEAGRSCSCNFSTPPTARAGEQVGFHRQEHVGALWNQCLGTPPGDTRCRWPQHDAFVPTSVLASAQAELATAREELDGWKRDTADVVKGWDMLQQAVRAYVAWAQGDGSRSAGTERFDALVALLADGKDKP